MKRKLSTKIFTAVLAASMSMSSLPVYAATTTEAATSTSSSTQTSEAKTSSTETSSAKDAKTNDTSSVSKSEVAKDTSSKDTKTTSTSTTADKKSDAKTSTTSTETTTETTTETATTTKKTEKEVEKKATSDISKTVDGVKVTAHTKGVLPDGVELDVKSISNSDLQKYEDIVNKDDPLFTAKKAYDISLSKDGKEYQPETDDKTVEISVSGAMGVAADDLKVYHMEDSKTPKKVNIDAESQGKTIDASFKTDSFSPFIFGDTINTDTDTTYTKNWTSLKTLKASDTTLSGTTDDVFYYADKKLLVVDTKDDTITNFILSEIIGTDSDAYKDATTVYIVGKGKIGEMLLRGMANITTVDAEGNDTEANTVELYNGYQTFGSMSKLETVKNLNIIAAGNITEMFCNDTKLQEVDLSHIAKGAADTNALYATTSLSKITFNEDNYQPTANSGWTSRWKKDGEADDTAKLAKDLITAGGLDGTYVKVTDDAKYNGTNGYRATGLGELNMYPVGSSDKKFTGYCLDWLKDIPSYYFEKQDMTASNVKDFLDTDTDMTKQSLARHLDNYSDDAYKAVKTIIYFGYPNDMADIQGSLTDKEYAAVTQSVMWYALDGISETQSLEKLGVTKTSAIDAAYTALAAKTYANVTDPDKVNVYAYAPETATEQALASGDVSVIISKTDVTGTDELVGASLKVTDSNGNTIDSWTSTSSTHQINGLVYGTEYTLTETTAPSGYKVAEAIKFTANGKHQEVTMKDSYKDHTVTVKKVDGDGTYVSGAVLTLTGTDTAGNSVSKSVTTAGSTVTFTVQPGTYKISETTVPSGYTKASDTASFTVKATSDDTDYVYTMVDTKITTSDVTISKTEITGKTELAGATLTVTDSGNNTVDTWTSTTTAHKISGLKIGSTYKLTETTAPAGYTVAESISFTVGTSSQTITMKDAYKNHTVTVKKVDGSGNRVSNAVLTLTGTTLAGASVSQNITTSDADVVFTVQPGTYKIEETTVPSGYEKATDLSFTVGANDSDSSTHVYTMTDNKTAVTTTTTTTTPCTVTVEKLDSVTKKRVAGAVLAIFDDKNTEVLRFTTVDSAPYVTTALKQGKTYTLQEVTAPTGYAKAAFVAFTVSSSNQTVTMLDTPLAPVKATAQRSLLGAKTGDSAMPIVWLVVLGIAAAGCVGMIVYKRKKKNS